MASLLERYADQIAGVLSCWDRVTIIGSLPGLGYAGGMTQFLDTHRIRIVDYAAFAKGIGEKLHATAEAAAKAAGLEVEYLQKPRAVRKEDRVRKILDKRGEHPGLVHVFKVVENCNQYEGFHDKAGGRMRLRSRSGRCTHYYFYFIDGDLGLCYLRVPTWCPFRLQFYFNGHNLLAAKLKAAGIGFDQRDNVFVALDDFTRAQELVDDLHVQELHKKLDHYVALYCPVQETLGVGFHWSLMQVEYSTDIVFKAAKDLKELYEALVRTAILTVKADNVATFLGKMPSKLPERTGSDFSTKLQGMRIKHSIGPVSIKMYDKMGLVLRVETTANDVSFFKHYREVVQKDGEIAWKSAPVQRTIYSLAPTLAQLLRAANARYIDFLSALDDPTLGLKILGKVTQPAQEHGRAYRGFNFFAKEDTQALLAIMRAEFVITGLRNRELRSQLPKRSAGQISRLLKRMRLHGLLKAIGGTYKYYVTALGRCAIVAALKLQEILLQPSLAPAAA